MRYKLFILLIFYIFSSAIHAQNLIQPYGSTLAQQWDISDSISNKSGLFKVNQYKPLYFLFSNITDNINEMPRSDNPVNNVSKAIPLNNIEFKFEISFKTKIANNLLGPKISDDIWAGYTQTSHWQLYNGKISRPFRETNYEPEIMYILPIHYSLLKGEIVFAGFGINHQSNGRENPLSRSWNRIIIQAAWENKNTSVILKRWYRVQESAEKDNNPGIENYIGRAELLTAFSKNRHHLSFLARHTLRNKENNRGSIQIDYAIRIWDNLKFHTEFFSGYGESLIDFNHKQTTIGFGLSLIEWR